MKNSFTCEYCGETFFARGLAQAHEAACDHNPQTQFCCTCRRWWWQENDDGDDGESRCELGLALHQRRCCGYLKKEINAAGLN